MRILVDIRCIVQVDELVVGDPGVNRQIYGAQAERYPEKGAASETLVCRCMFVEFGFGPFL